MFSKYYTHYEDIANNRIPNYEEPSYRSLLFLTRSILYQCNYHIDNTLIISDLANYYIRLIT